LIMVDSATAGSGMISFKNVTNVPKMNLIGFSGNNFNSEQYIDIWSDSVFVATFRGNGRMGVGVFTPQEKLDVNGNINLTGTIKANGVDGTPNQVLMKNSSGNFGWGDIGDYKNTATFTSIGSNTWTVPAGVTRILAEAWGAGGGASTHGG